MNSKMLSVKYIRNGLAEEVHNVHVSFGNDNNSTPYFLRSCAKPLQASLLIDYGIDFTPEEIAFCSGSHAGEECHEKIANQILNKLNLDESYLKCGIHAPLSRTMQNKMLLKGITPTAIHNNCSGKHLGFLAICKKMNWDLNTYYKPEHPLQIEVKTRINNLCEVKDIYPATTDGCGVPIVSMPLKNLVIGYKNLYNKYPKLVNAIINHPYIYGGENRLDTEIMEKSEGLIAKVGAGGLCVVYNTKIKEGFAVKAEDASMEARRFAVLNIINILKWSNIEYDSKIKTIAGKVVGEIKVCY